MTGDSSFREPTRSATRLGSRELIDMARLRYHSYGSATADGLRAYCGVVFLMITRGSRRLEPGWKAISRRRFIPARSRLRVKSIATRPISITLGRSRMRSARWGSRRSTLRVERSPGPMLCRTSSSAASAETELGPTASPLPRKMTPWSPRHSRWGRSATAGRFWLASRGKLALGAGRPTPP